MDARVRYTRKVIKEAILELLSQKNADKITVKEICDKAQINRATFYKHYENTYDLLEKLDNEMLDELEAKIKEVNLADLRSIFSIVLNEVRDNRSYYELMFIENGDRRFRDRLFELCLFSNMEVINRFFPALNDKQKKWLYYFIAEGLTGVMSKWMQDGYSESVEEVVEFLVTLIESVNYTMKFKISKY